MSTEVIFILDRSGSMGSLEKDVIGGFNSMLHEQRASNPNILLTTVLFDDKCQILHDRISIADVEDITDKEYYVRGTTALLDAVGKTLQTVKARTKKSDTVMVIINTDGYENSSKEYTNTQIRDAVKKLQEKRNWKFVFIGADIDSYASGTAIGIAGAFCFTSSKTGDGVRSVYNAVSTSLSTLSTTGNIKEEDYKQIE